MEQAPVATSVTVVPETVQTDVVVEVKMTASPELAVAEMLNGGVPNATLFRTPNEMVWFACVTVNPLVTDGAAL
jgi:hypothetical protein